MNDLDLGAFKALFQETCLRCFGHAVSEPLTETESRLLYNKVFDETGLVVGWKSLKNYSFFVFSPGGKEENPSVATLDTLSRYVLGAPYTTEPERKKAAGHYPYWYQYKEAWARGVVDGQGDRPGRSEPGTSASEPRRSRGRRSRWVAGGLFVALALGIAVWSLVFRTGVKPGFRDDFHSLGADSLAARGWWATAIDTTYWNRRGEQPGCLTLYTLKGDYWPDPEQQPVIRNLLLRRIPCDCFTLELHLQDFIPRQNWQQAGILLLEDTGFSGRSMRVSLAYNDYNGVYPRSGTILLQAISSLAAGKPEEIAHVTLLHIDSLLNNPALASSFSHPALRIEKQGDRFRILYSDGILANTSFREIAVHELSMQPRYVGVFALKGFVDSSRDIPARFTFFSLDCAGCGGR